MPVRFAMTDVSSPRQQRKKSVQSRTSYPFQIVAADTPPSVTHSMVNGSCETMSSAPLTSRLTPFPKRIASGLRLVMRSKPSVSSSFSSVMEEQNAVMPPSTSPKRFTIITVKNTCNPGAGLRMKLRCWIAIKNSTTSTSDARPIGVNFARVSSRRERMKSANVGPIMSARRDR